MPKQTQASPKLGSFRSVVDQSTVFIPRGLKSPQAGLGYSESSDLGRVVLLPGEGISDLMSFHKVESLGPRNVLTYTCSVYHLQELLSSTRTEEDFPHFTEETKAQGSPGEAQGHKPKGTAPSLHWSKGGALGNTLGGPLVSTQ